MRNSIGSRSSLPQQCAHNVAASRRRGSNHGSARSSSPSSSRDATEHQRETPDALTPRTCWQETLHIPGSAALVTATRSTSATSTRDPSTGSARTGKRRRSTCTAARCRAGCGSTTDPLLVVAGLERRICPWRDGVTTTFADATSLVGWALNDSCVRPTATATSAPWISTSLPNRARPASPARWCTSRRTGARPSRRARSRSRTA